MLREMNAAISANNDGSPQVALLSRQKMLRRDENNLDSALISLTPRADVKLNLVRAGGKN
jgi:hypothetical protein